MEFKIPKFLERESKFFFFLTFKQLIILGIISLFLFFLYYLLPRSVFFVIVFIIGGASLSLMIISVEGIPLYQLAGDFLNFLFSSKKYIWQRKIFPIIKLSKKEKELEKKQQRKKIVLKIATNSRLKDLSSRIERGVYE